MACGNDKLLRSLILELPDDLKEKLEELEGQGYTVVTLMVDLKPSLIFTL